MKSQRRPKSKAGAGKAKALGDTAAKTLKRVTDRAEEFQKDLMKQADQAKGKFVKNAEGAWDSLIQRAEGTVDHTVLRAMKLALTVIDFQKTTFDNTFKLLQQLQEQSEKMVQELVKHAAWMPPEGKALVDEWVRTLRGGRSEFKKSVDKSFDLITDYFERVQKEAKKKPAPKKRPAAKKKAAAKKKPAAKKKAAPKKKPAAKKKAAAS